MSVNVSTNKNSTEVSVTGDAVEVSVSGGIGPQGPAGAGGVTSLQGLAGALTLAAVGGSWAVSGSTITLTVNATGNVTSVAGRTGDVVLAVADVSGAVATTDSRLSDAREWSAATVTQAQSEAGTDTSRLAWSVLRVWQAIAAWWAASASKAKLDGIATGATANQTDAYLLSRANHTGTQAAGTITGLATVATSGSASDLGAGTLPAARLPNTTVTAGSYGSASSVATFTVDSAGRLTAAGSTSIAIAAGAVSGLAGIATSGSGADLTAASVTNAKLANVSTATFKGRATAGAGSPEDITGTQATALLDTFTSSAKGLAPASGGGTANYLRADGTWATPPGTGGGGGTTVVSTLDPFLLMGA